MARSKRARDEHRHEYPAASELRERGRRLTKQRAAIWDVLTADPDQHLSAEEVAGRVQRAIPGLNPSTVYRTLDVLVQEGLVRRTDLGSDRRFYEPANEHLHHHLVCESCGAVQHVHEDVFGKLAARIEDAAGFVLADRELTLFGLCRRCARGARQGLEA